MGSRGRIAAAAGAVVLIAGGCGGEGGSALSSGEADLAAFADGAQLVREFERLAAAAGGGQRRPSADDLASGVEPPECLALDAAGAAAVGEALGAGALRASPGLLSGLRGNELQDCGLHAAGGRGEPIAVVAAGTTSFSAGRYVNHSARLSDVEPVDPGPVEALDPESVVAFSDGERVQLTWIDEGFLVAVDARADSPASVRLGAALPVAVAEVSRTLRG